MWSRQQAKPQEEIYHGPQDPQYRSMYRNQQLEEIGEGRVSRYEIDGEATSHELHGMPTAEFRVETGALQR